MVNAVRTFTVCLVWCANKNKFISMLGLLPYTNEDSKLSTVECHFDHHIFYASSPFSFRFDSVPNSGNMNAIFIRGNFDICFILLSFLSPTTISILIILFGFYVVVFFFSSQFWTKNALLNVILIKTKNELMNREIGRIQNIKMIEKKNNERMKEKNEIKVPLLLLIHWNVSQNSI